MAAFSKGSAQGLDMDWSQHGEYTLDRKGDVLVVVTHGDWNEVAIRHLVRDARPFWRLLNGLRWGCLVDARQWTGVTPEALEAWQRLFENGSLAAGMAATAVVLPEPLFMGIVRSAAHRLDAMCPCLHSLELPAAWQWLAARGVDCGSADPLSPLQPPGVESLDTRC